MLAAKLIIFATNVSDNASKPSERCESTACCAQVKGWRLCAPAHGAKCVWSEEGVRVEARERARNRSVAHALALHESERVLG
jgi:hypothetical protein